MKPFLFAIMVSVVGVGCVDALKAGPSPRGFIIGHHMHYWSPKIARDHPQPYYWPQFRHTVNLRREEALP